MIYAYTDEGKAQAQLECDMTMRKNGGDWQPIPHVAKAHRDGAETMYWQPQKVTLMPAKDGDKDRHARRTMFHA